jgi:hypothetical protein
VRQENGFHKFGMGVLWSAIVLAVAASIGVFVFIAVTGEGLLAWLLRPIGWAFMAMTVVAIAFLVIGAIVGVRR